MVLSLTATPTRSGGINGDIEEFAINPDTGLPLLAYLRGSDPQGTYSAMASKVVTDSYGAVLAYTADFDNKRLLWDTTVGWRPSATRSRRCAATLPDSSARSRSSSTPTSTPTSIFEA